MSFLPRLLLLALGTALAAQDPIPVLLVGGANNHDWKFTTPEIASVLTETGRFAVTTTEEPAKALADAAALAKFKVIVLDYNGPRWGEPAEKAFLQAVEGGVGVVVIHAADNAFPGWVEFEKLIVLRWTDGTTGHGSYHPFDVKVIEHEHPITKGFADMTMHPDELYHKLVHMHGAAHQVLMTAFSDPKTGGTGKDEPMALVSTYGKGRMFHTPLGHTWSGALPTRATWADSRMRLLIARGTEWAATGAVTLPTTPMNWLTDEEREQKFERLFDGRTLKGWHVYQQKEVKDWVAKDAAIQHPAGVGGGDLVSDEDYGDFDFRFQWRVAKNGNSGVIWHVVENQPETYMTGPEYQVLDDLTQKPGPKHAAGALYDMVPAAEHKVLPAGEWNEGRIVIQGGRVQHWLNGTKVVDVPCVGPEWEALVKGSKFKDWPFGKSATGKLALQYHGDAVSYRNLRLKKL